MSPIDRALSLAGPYPASAQDRLDPAWFGARGIAPIGYAAFALVLGVTLSVLVRRTLPAMAATLAVFAGVQIAWPIWIRPHLIPPSVARLPLSPDDIGRCFTSGVGKQVTIVGTWHPAGAWVLSDKSITPAGDVFTGPATKACWGTQRQFDAWLASKHLRQLVTFQPGSRFWAFQWYETAIFVLLAVALAGFCAWRIRRGRLA